MSEIVLKTAKRKTSISRAAVRKAVQATFVAGSLVLKSNTGKNTIKKAARKNAA